MKKIQTQLWLTILFSAFITVTGCNSDSSSSEEENQEEEEEECSEDDDCKDDEICNDDNECEEVDCKRDSDCDNDEECNDNNECEEVEDNNNNNNNNNNNDATCIDGIQNQGETGVDCGGPCAPCQNNGGGDATTQAFTAYCEKTAECNAEINCSALSSSTAECVAGLQQQLPNPDPQILQQLSAVAAATCAQINGQNCTAGTGSWVITQLACDCPITETATSVDCGAGQYCSDLAGTAGTNVGICLTNQSGIPTGLPACNAQGGCEGTSSICVQNQCIDVCEGLEQPDLSNLPMCAEGQTCTDIGGVSICAMGQGLPPGTAACGAGNTCAGENEIPVGLQDGSCACALQCNPNG